MRVTKGLEDSIGFLEIELFAETKLRVTHQDKERPEHTASRIYQFGGEHRKKVLKLLEYALQQYEQHYSKPFIWGGVSPLTLQEQPNDPFQQETPRYKTQPKPSWREGLPMELGFDCIGFLRWIYGNNGSELFRGKKKTVEEYRQAMGATPRGYNLDTVLSNAKPGDLIFKCDPETGKAYHSMMYFGNGLVLECSGEKTLDYKNIPSEEWHKWQRLTQGRFIPDENHPGEKGWPVSDLNRGGIQISHISKYSHYKIAIATPDILKG